MSEMVALTVSIPVGPRENHRAFLNDCLFSIYSQLEPTDNILLIVEGADLPDYVSIDGAYAKALLMPVRLGVAAMVNLSVGYAKTEHVLLMNSDDKLLPGALDAVRESWHKYGMDERGWYYLNTVYSDGTEQKTASGVAMVCRSHFLAIGGYPPETAVGFPDWMFLSLMQSRGLIKPYPVSDKCLHWHRIHDEQETLLRKKEWNEAAKIVHNTLIRTWPQ